MSEWIRADSNHLPNNKEHILFYADWWENWSHGVFYSYDRVVKTQVSSRVFHCTVLENGMYWMRVPELPERKRRRRAE